jgi:hypothetical protein
LDYKLKDREKKIMKIILISAFLCLAGLSQAGNVQRFARNTEAIIPTIVEEILKVELQSDLKKNSAVEVDEEVPVVKTIKEEVIVDPVASRIIEEVVTIEEKKPEVVEAVKEIVPEVVSATRNVEPVVEVVEKVEVVAVKEDAEKPVDNFRTESVPAVEQVAEIVKEIVPVETVAELRKEEVPVVMAVVKETEIVEPMFRNVIKEEIPQVEELRTVPVEAVKDVVPEPIQASNVVAEPVVAVEPQVKTILTETVKEVVVPEVKAAPVEVPEVKVTPVEVPEVKAVPVVPAPVAPIVQVPVEIVKDEPIKEEKVEAAVVPEVKAVVPEVKPVVAPVQVVDEADPQTRQDRPTIVQAIQQNLAGLPVVGQIFNRNPAIADEAAPASDTESTSAPVSEEKPPAPQGPLAQVGEFFQNAVQNTQNNLGTFVSNVQNALTPQNNNNAGDRPQNPVANFIQGAISNVQNIINPTTASTVVKDDVKPEKTEEEKPEATKSVEPEPAVVDPVVVQKEVVEPKKVDEEKEENIVKV